MPLRFRVHKALGRPAEGDTFGRVIALLLVLLILANVTAVVAETVPGVGDRYALEFEWFETVSLIVFSVEYVLRLWACVVDQRYAHPVRGRVRFAMRPMMIVDLLAILPGLLVFTSLDLRVLRTLRLLRVLRLLKLTRHSAAMQAFGNVLRGKAPELASTLFVMMLLLVMASSLMYYIEHPANPAFDSIPTAMWWGIATFTTVGYGDITPITPMGRLLGGAVGILGIAMFAIPAGLLGAAFSEEMAKRRKQPGP